MYKPLFMKREVLVFRRWKRTGYALFACLGREVVIGVLSVTMLSSVKAVSISEETFRIDTTQVVREVRLGDVGVTGSRAPLALSQAARMVTVLSHDDIQGAAVQSINDLLKMAVGVDVRQRGTLGSQTDVSIRGGTQEQIIVLLNGINICDPQTGHNVLDLPVDLSEIVRIEVLEGPAGRTYGTSSLVGAVNIVTHPAPSSGADISVEGGSFGYVKAAGRINILQKRWNNQVSGSYARSDGFSRSAAGRLNTDFTGGKAFYQGSYADGQVSIRWHAGFSDKGWGSSTFYATPRWQADEQYEHTTKLLAAVQAETLQGAIHLRPSLYWQQHSDRFEGYRGRPDIMKYNYNRCNVYGANLNSYFDWAWGRTAFGGELRNEDHVSGNLGEPLFQPIHISGTDRKYTLGINRTNVSLFLEHNVLLQRLTVSAGIIAARSSWSTGGWGVYPGIDVSYQLAARWKMYASYNTSLRLPSFTEMYYKLQGYAADPHLRPEEMRAIEVGTHYQLEGIDTKLSLYHHHGRNMIDWVMDTSQGDDAVWQSVNHTVINSVGAEASLTLDLRRLLTLPTSHTTLHLSCNLMSQDKKQEPSFVSQYALEYLRHKLVVRLQSSLWRQLSLGMNVRWQDRMGTYTGFDGLVHDYRPFALVDARLAWTAQRYTLYAEVNNVLDNRNYVDYGNVPQPGAWLIVGARWHIPF